MRRLILVLIVGIAVAVVGYSLFPSGSGAPERSVLVVELGGELEEAPPVDWMGRLLAGGPALPTLLLQLEKAAVDRNVTGVLVHVRTVGGGWGRVQELRDALAHVRDAGKKVVALLDLASLNATREYYLASAADEVWVVPGFLGPLAGIGAQYLHLGDFLAKLGILVEFERAGEYKSAPEMFAAREMSEPARKMVNEILDELFGQILSAVADRRKLPPTRVHALIDAAPSTAQEYVDAGLADGVADRQSVLQAAGFGDANELSVEDYFEVDPRDLGLRKGPGVALIFGQGLIVQQGAARGFGARGFIADATVEALKEAGEREDVKAVVLRIDSGGGSALASDQIWRAVRRLRERKPVVVSMGDAAASGGYYIASAADAIVAEPATLTGSIGVFFLRPSLAGLYEKLGIGSEVVTRGERAAVAVSDEPFTAEQREWASRFVRALYGDFLTRVAEGREMSPDAVDAVGRGHVWLGAAALRHGLIDELGGLSAAVRLAASRAGIPGDSDPERVILPGPRQLWQQVRDLLGGSALAALTERLLPVRLPAILRGGQLPHPGEPTLLPPVWIELR